MAQERLAIAAAGQAGVLAKGVAVAQSAMADMLGLKHSWAGYWRWARQQGCLVD